MKKRYIILIILLILGLSYWFFYSRDEPLPRDDDLKLVRILVPANENALYPLRQAVENLYLPRQYIMKVHDILDGEKWDEEFVRELLEKNKVALEYFEKAVELSVFQIPIPEKITLEIEEVEPVSGPRMLEIARLVSIQSAYLFKQGKEKQAFDTAMKKVELGHMMRNSQSPPPNYLIGVAIKKIGLTRLKSFIPETTLSSDLLKNYIKELEEFKKIEQGKGIISVIKLDYEIMRIILDKGYYVGYYVVFDEKMKIPDFPPHRFKPNQTKRIFAESYRFYINNISKPYSKIKEFQHPEMEDFDWDAPKIVRLFSRNFEGKSLFSSSAALIKSIIVRSYRTNFFINSTQLLLAMRSYQIENRELPESLERLVPEYFVKIPQDPFDGNYIRYCKEKRIIYSVGENLKDEEGEGDDFKILIDF